MYQPKYDAGNEDLKDGIKNTLHEHIHDPTSKENFFDTKLETFLRLNRRLASAVIDAINYHISNKLYPEFNYGKDSTNRCGMEKITDT